MPDPQSPSLTPAALSLWLRRLIQFTAAVAALFILYTEGVNAWRNTQEAIKAKAVADNATVRQKAEAEQAFEQARTQLESALVAARQFKLEADIAERKNTQTDIAQNWVLKGTGWHCPGRYSFEKINAKMEGRC